MWFLNGGRNFNNATKWLPWCGMVDLQSGKPTKSLFWWNVLLGCLRFSYHFYNAEQPWLGIWQEMPVHGQTSEGGFPAIHISSENTFCHFYTLFQAARWLRSFLEVNW